MDHHKTQIKNLPENQHEIQRNYHNSERFVEICTGVEDVRECVMEREKEKQPLARNESKN